MPLIRGKLARRIGRRSPYGVVVTSDPRRHQVTPEVAFGHPTGGATIPAADEETRRVTELRLAADWGITGSLRPTATGSTSRIWNIGDERGGLIAKLARGDRAHVDAGLRASRAVQAGGLRTGTPVPTPAGALSAEVAIGADRWWLAVLTRVGGVAAPMAAFEPPTLGALLATIHEALRGTDPTGAWTPANVFSHMRDGISDGQPPQVRQLITSAVDAVERWYGDVCPPMQMIRGDGPEILSRPGEPIAAMIDWGGVRRGSVADDIGCWTLHGSTGDHHRYTDEFVRGYVSVRPLIADERAAIPLFQRLRLASRACGVADRSALAAIETWMDSYACCADPFRDGGSKFVRRTHGPHSNAWTPGSHG